MLHFAIVAVIAFAAGLILGAGIMNIIIKDAAARGGKAARNVSSARFTQIGGDHYRSKTIQPWDAMEAWMSREQFKGFLRGNAIKYLARCDDKGGMEDIKKAGHYIARMLEEK